MTDPEFADRTYIEPITPAVVEMIMAKEKPDALLPTLGGQTALNTAMALHESGALTKHGVKLIGAQVEAIRKGEDRQLLKECMAKNGHECARAGTPHPMEGGAAVAPTETCGNPKDPRTRAPMDRPRYTPPRRGNAPGGRNRARGAAPTAPYAFFHRTSIVFPIACGSLANVTVTPP